MPSASLASVAPSVALAGTCPAYLPIAIFSCFAGLLVFLALAPALAAYLAIPALLVVLLLLKLMSAPWKLPLLVFSSFLMTMAVAFVQSWSYLAAGALTGVVSSPAPWGPAKTAPVTSATSCSALVASSDLASVWPAPIVVVAAAAG